MAVGGPVPLALSSLRTGFGSGRECSPLPLFPLKTCHSDKLQGLGWCGSQQKTLHNGKAPPPHPHPTPPPPATVLCLVSVVSGKAPAGARGLRMPLLQLVPNEHTAPRHGTQQQAGPGQPVVRAHR